MTTPGHATDTPDSTSPIPPISALEASREGYGNFSPSVPPYGSSYASEQRHSPQPTRRKSVVPIVVAAAVGVLVAGGAVGLMYFRPWEQRQPVPAASSTLKPKEGDAQSDSAVTGSTNASSKSDEVPVRSDLSQYSWEELGKISKSLEGKSRSAALELLASYNLVGKDGSMLDAAKEVSLGALGTMHVRLVDVCHDSLAGTGAAPMTFLSADLPCRHRVNKTNTDFGGWRDSELRSWLNSAVYNALPSDLRSVIRTVLKSTNNVGQTTSVVNVTPTEDKLWAPSVVEVGGPIQYSWDSDPANSDNYNAVINAEGTQYAYFQPKISNNEGANASLALCYDGKAIKWWLRSANVSKDHNFRAVEATGDPSWYEDASHDIGVCIGFCV